MTAIQSGLYVGKVWHRRSKPKRHRLEYRVYSMLCDLDELPTLSRRLWLFSHNRFNVFSILDRDFGAGDGSALKPWVETQLQAAGLQSAGLSISLLCYPRLLGYAFNPLSVFFCRRMEDGALIAILYEVHNTFGERHCYLIAGEQARGTVNQNSEKRFYVSPFVTMSARYRFRVVPPELSARDGDKLSIVIHESDETGPLLDAAFVAHRDTLSDRRLCRLLWSHPLMTVKVIVGIHWEALKLWLKGMKLIDRPPAPEALVTVVSGSKASRQEPEHPFRSAA